MKHSAKTSEMSETIKRLESVRHGSMVAILKIARFGLTISALNNLLMYKVKPEAIYTFVLALAAILAATVGLMYGFSILLTRRTRSTAALQKKVVAAYLQALDQSSFNPHSLNKQHEQLNK